MAVVPTPGADQVAPGRRQGRATRHGAAFGAAATAVAAVAAVADVDVPDEPEEGRV